MSLFGTQAIETKRGPRGVWPYFFMAIICVFAYVFTLLSLWPWGYPTRDELVETGGEISSVRIRDVISGTSAGAGLPTHVSVYFTFRDLEGEYEYPWNFPKYIHARDRTAVYADILVEKAALAEPGPYLIWGVKEDNNHKAEEKQTIITYEEIEAQLLSQQQTLDTMLRWLGGGAVALSLWGWYTIRWNRRNYPPLI